MLLKNVASMAALNFYKNALQFLMNVVIAALISPMEYGLVAFTTPFVALVSLLTDLGFSSAIVRQPNLTAKQAGAAWTATLLAGVLFAAGLALAAIPISAATEMNGLRGVMTAMSVAVLLSVAATIPRALLERRLQYSRIALIEAVSVFVSAVTSIAAAWLGAGVWALVSYSILTQLLRAVSFGWLVRRDLVPNRNWRALGSMLSLGIWVLATNILNFIARNSDNVLIGAALGAASVGLYGLAYQFMLIPLMAVAWPASGVLLATLSQPGNASAQKGVMVSGLIAITAMFSFPVMMFLTFGLKFPVEAFMSAKWHGVEDIVRVLAPVGALQSLASYNGAILLARGEARLQFLVGVVNSLTILMTFILCLPFGLMVLVKVYAGVSVLLSLGFLGLICWKANLAVGKLVQAIVPATLATAAGLTLVYATTGFEITTRTEWLLSTGFYALGVLALYALMLRPICRYLAVLNRTGHAA